MTLTTCTLAAPTSVKDILDLIGKLETLPDLKTKVINQIEDDIKKHLNVNGVPEKSVKKHIEGTFYYVKSLRRVLLKEPDKYGVYDGIINESACPDACATVLIDWLPVLRSELYYLYFQTTTDYGNIGGFWWKPEQIIDDSGKNVLQKWLTDALDKKDVPLISKGFKDSDLHEISRSIHVDAHTGVSFYTGGPLDHAQFGLFFLQKGNFRDSNLASAVLFLEEFCTQVNDESNGIFKDAIKQSSVVYTTLETECQNISKHLGPITDSIMYALYNTQTAEEVGTEAGKTSQSPQRTTAVKNPYKDNLKSDQFQFYFDWSKKNFAGIKGSLQKMLKESYGWNKEYFNEGKSPGPFKYGFVFKEKEWNSSICMQLKKHIEGFTIGTSSAPTADNKSRASDKDKAESTEEGDDQKSSQPKSPAPEKTREQVKDAEQSPDAPPAKDSERLQMDGTSSTSQDDKDASPRLRQPEHPEEIIPPNPGHDLPPPPPMQLTGDLLPPSTDGLAPAPQRGEHHHEPSLATGVPSMPWVILLIYVLSKIF